MGHQPSGQRPALCFIPAAEVGMDERHPAGKSGQGGRRGFPEIPKQQAIGGRDRVGMGGHLALEDVDRPFRQTETQMVVAAPVPQAKLHDRARQPGDQARRQVEAGPLGLQPPDEAA